MPTPKNRASKFGAERATQHIRTRFNPIRGLTPQKLSTALDAFSGGQLRTAALLWQKIADRDDQVITCQGKRARKVAGLNWEILSSEDSSEAAAHKQALEDFYNGLSAVNALEENERGDVELLIAQMQSAIGMRYAFHEIVWQPGAPGGLTAEFRFIPLQFFENTTGHLKFLPDDFAYYGQEPDAIFGEGGYMVTAGRGLMEATSVAYMFKNMPLKAWVGYCEKFGTPPLHGKTNAAKGSEEWEAMRDALTAFGEDLAILTNIGAEITPIELKNAGNAPHAALVDRMDRAISRIWLGGDLATMSKDGSAVGSQPQSDDLAELVREDCSIINRALRYHVDRWIIRYRFGEGVAPKAYFELQPDTESDVERDLKVDDFLIKVGAPVGKKDLLERYGRPEPDAGDDLATAPAAAPSPFGPALPPRPAINEADTRLARTFRAHALDMLIAARGEDFKPLRDRLAAALQLPDDRLTSAIMSIQRDFPALSRAVFAGNAGANAREKIDASALASGAAEGRSAQPSRTSAFTA